MQPSVKCCAKCECIAQCKVKLSEKKLDWYKCWLMVEPCWRIICIHHHCSSLSSSSSSSSSSPSSPWLQCWLGLLWEAVGDYGKPRTTQCKNFLILNISMEDIVSYNAHYPYYIPNPSYYNIDYYQYVDHKNHYNVDQTTAAAYGELGDIHRLLGNFEQARYCYHHLFGSTCIYIYVYCIYVCYHHRHLIIAIVIILSPLKRHFLLIIIIIDSNKQAINCMEHRLNIAR